MSLRVLIAGGGLGGLTLAHGLRRAGLQPLVFERSQPEVDLSASYRIHIDANGSRALHTCLPPAVWSTFEAHAARPPRGIAFATEQLRRLVFIEDADPAQEPVAHAHPISRSGLRQLLLTGLDDVVTFNSRVEGYEVKSSGQVVAHLAGGETATGDVLVGADGSASAVRKQLLPEARVVDTHVGGIAGKVYLTDAVRAQLGQTLLSQMTMVLPMRGMAMFLAPFQCRSEQQRLSGNLDLPEHLFWVLIGPSNAFESVMTSRDRAPADLRACALSYVERWHPLLRSVVMQADPASLLGVPLHTAQPVAAWAAGRVTLLGDAIHTMTPLQGLGGNTALVDAAVLSGKLADAAAGRLELVQAIREYEAAMHGYGFEAVEQSLQVSNSVASENVFGRAGFRTVLQVADHVPWLRRLMFQRTAAPAFSQLGAA